MNNKEFIDAMKHSINLNKDDIVEMTKLSEIIAEEWKNE